MIFEEIFRQNKEYQKITEELKNGVSPVNVTGITDFAKPHFIKGLFDELKKSVVVILRNEAEIKNLNEQLSFFKLNPDMFVSREYNFYNVEAASRELFTERIRCLFDAANEKRNVYLTSIEAVSQLVLDKEKIKNSVIKIEDGTEVDLENLTKQLIYMGYKNCDMVEAGGQFSLRGGILDIFTFTNDHPFRIELFGDEIDSIRRFDERTQLSTDKVFSFEITPSNEYLLTDEEKSSLAEIIKKEIKKTHNEELKENLKSDLEKLNNSGYFSGLDKYMDLLLKSSFIDYFDRENTVFILDEPQRISEKKEALENERGEIIVSLTERNIVREGYNPYIEITDIYSKMLKFSLVGLCNILTSITDYHPQDSIGVTTAPTPTYYGKINLFSEDILNYTDKGYTVLIPVGKTKIENFKTLLLNYGIHSSVVSEDKPLKGKGVFLLPQNGQFGFVYPAEKFVLLYDHTVFGGYKQPLKAKKKGENAITSFNDLKIGDYVVHNVHGVGQYVGVEKLVVENTKKDYLKIKYQGTDTLYVPTNQLDNLNKYIGAGEVKVKLNKLGGQDFSRVKSRVKASCAQLAEKLIALYAEREKSEGYAYSPDTDMQAQFEQKFPFQETNDQLISIDEVKKDMESNHPMDRLLCGDVGYGKTEVALRAAFKCVADGKQVAYLAATTVLAQQHFNTFKQRMEDFPVNVEMLSRFRTKKQQEEIVKKLKQGRIDVIVGTHRILSNDVEFKDLGLLIVDEEQRFGVAHKEKLKEMKKNIEVLTLSATPIPRTLHMSMLGIRDMSVLAEPPQDRFPVQTYVMEYNEMVIKDAIEKELSRGGQVYYLFNRVEGIEAKTKRIRELCPSANVAYAHGKMGERAMENTFIKMLSGEIDVLICTTIIETGLDISNANTIIIENSDRLGLSQLYQLRGRVGRSDRLAYCYLTYQKNKAITQESENRLKAIKEFTEFGSGFKIAMRDLEIRGAGNVLGGEQHGHMDAVGYDLYMKILEETVKEKKGEKTPEKIECRVDIKVNAYIPENYIVNHDIRMDMYKRIADIKTEEDMNDLTDELTDRFSDIPNPVYNLLTAALIKAMAESVGISEINDAGGKITFVYYAPQFASFEKISEAAAAYKGCILVNATGKPGFNYKIPQKDLSRKLENIKNILQILK